MTAAQFYALPDDERDWWVADWELERGKCNQCGGDRATCSDPDRAWYPQRTVCYSMMAAQSANARYDAQHEDMPYHDGTFTRWAPKRSALFPFGHRDGVTIWVAPDDLNPDDDFLGTQHEQGVPDADEGR